MSKELAFLLSEQAKDRYQEFEAQQSSTSPQHGEGDEDEDEGSLKPSPSQLLSERRRLRYAAQLAERANRLAQEDEDR